MAGRTPATRFSEFRHFAETIKWDKMRIDPLLIPPLAAYMLMISKRQVAAMRALQHKHVTKTVPGVEEGIRFLKASIDSLVLLTRNLPENFKRSDWEPAVAEVCALMGIEPGHLDFAPADGTALSALLESPTDGSDTTSSGGDAEPRGIAPPKGTRPARKPRRR